MYPAKIGHNNVGNVRRQGDPMIIWNVTRQPFRFIRGAGLLAAIPLQTGVKLK
jgi:hypothetical protein